MSRIEHPLSQEELMAYADGQRSDIQASEAAAHLNRCSDCAAYIEETKTLSHQILSWKVEESPQRISEYILSELNRPVNVGRPHGKSFMSRWTMSRVLKYGLAGALGAVLLFTLTLPSLLRSRQAAPFNAAATQPGMETFVAPGAPLAPVPPQSSSGPMVIRTVKLSFITQQFAAARSGIDAVVRQFQGYIDDLTVRADTGSVRTLSATLRLPANQSESGVNELKKLGRLIQESQNSADVTKQYVDLTGRLSNARNSEQRLLALLRDRTGNLKDVIEVEHQIAVVREGIERMQAEQKDLDNKVQFVTIRVDVSEEYHAQLEPSTPSTRTQLRNATVDGIRSAGESAIDIALFVLRYGPVFLVRFSVFGSLIALIWFVRKKAARSAS